MSQITIAPHNQQPFVKRFYPSETELDEIIDNSAKAQKAWSRIPLKERIELGWKFIVSIDGFIH
jgi:hypothetical protein